MSLVAKLKPHVEDLKVHKRIGDMTATERRLNFMTAIILNKNLSKEEKDARLKKIVADSQIEKKLKDMGIRVQMVKKFIKGAIKHKGALRRFAEQHRLVKSNGLIDLRRAHEYAKRHHLPHRLRQIHLAATLRRLRLGMCKDCPKG